METPSFTALIAQAVTEAARRGGGVRIQRLDGGWETSIAVGERRLAIVRDEYLEAALMRLNARARVAAR